MEQKNQTLTEKYFEDVYAAKEDPWDFETSEYEAKKYLETLRALPRASYENAFEIGCSIGVLTEKLATRCKRLLAIDISDKALEKARRRCENLPHVRFQKMNVSEEFPSETEFDLILVSEVAYYLSARDWRDLSEKIYEKLRKGGHAALVHWLPEVADYPQTGDEVHESFGKFAGNKMRLRHKARHEKFRIDVWEKI